MYSSATNLALGPRPAYAGGRPLANSLKLERKVCSLVMKRSRLSMSKLLRAVCVCADGVWWAIRVRPRLG